MSLVIPTFALPSCFFQIALEGVVYRMAFKWNHLYEFYTMDILTFEGSAIVTGVKLVINYPLINRYGNPLLPPGELIAVDTTGKLDRIGFDNLGEEVKLIYIPEAELDAII